MGTRMGLGVAAGLVVGAAVGGWLAHGASFLPNASATQSSAQADELSALKAEVARLKGVVPDQAHAMSDVGQHFANLWFAGESGNWPLAQFCLDETRSH